MTDSNSIGGALVAADGDAGPPDATVEVWTTEWPTDVVPDDRPRAEMESLTESDEKVVERTHLGTTSTDEAGEFSVSLDEIPDGVFVRAFDDEGELLGSVTVESYDPESPVAVPVDTSSGILAELGWKLPAAAGSGVAATVLGGAYVLSQSDDGKSDESESGGSGGDGSEDGGPSTTSSATGGDFSTDLDVPAPAGPPPRTVAGQAAFLYSGEDPVQEGVDPAAIDDTATTVLRGRVRSRSGDPLEGVTVRVQDNPQYGSTTTRDTGLFDLAVTGGGTLTLLVEKEGWLPAQRTREVPPREYVWVDDLALTETDGEETTVSMGATEAQVARASPVEDEDGTRQATLVVPPNTNATVGTDNPTRAQDLTLRMTEYSVGENGPAAMPGELPAGTGYTYAVELSGEAGGSDSDSGGLSRPLATAPADVSFDAPVVFYVENFLDFDVGGPAPMGLFDRESASWEPSDDGRVVEMLGASNGLADIDVTGTGQPASANSRRQLGISDEERRQLAGLYEAGTTLWRVPVPHFTPGDINWPIVPPDDAEDPPLSDDDVSEGRYSDSKPLTADELPDEFSSDGSEGEC